MKPGGRADHPVELLSASIDRELRPAESAALETHLEACAECRGLLGDFRRLDEAITSEPVPPVPAGLEERILLELPSRRSPAPPRRFWRQAMPLAAAASLVMAVLLWYERPDRLPMLLESSPATATDAVAPAAPKAGLPEARSDAPAASSRSMDAGANANEMKKSDEMRIVTNVPGPPGATAPAPPPALQKGFAARRQAEPHAESAPPAQDQWKVEPGPAPAASAPQGAGRANEEQEAMRLAAQLEAARVPQEAARAVAPAAAAPAAPAPASAAAEIEMAGKQEDRLETDKTALTLTLLPLCAGSPAPILRRGEPGRAAAAAARPASLPFALLASPYAVRLEPDHRLHMERGDYACTVVIDDPDGRTIAAALDESMRRSAVSPVTAEQPAAACLVEATPAAHQAVVRLIQERYRGAIEKTCGALPN
ncbi:MAG TPA: zf-HC2 domain-containing protein [Candidatus Polarisedimenticolia bacterium]|nr:zf-HC2 domain-containing protein [Candidatus Polarisedimenticolia bacterium]